MQSIDGQPRVVGQHNLTASRQTVGLGLFSGVLFKREAVFDNWG
jgi:hypothetical protein